MSFALWGFVAPLCEKRKRDRNTKSQTDDKLGLESIVRKHSEFSTPAKLLSEWIPEDATACECSRGYIGGKGQEGRKR